MKEDFDKVKQSIDDLNTTVDVLKDLIAGLTTSLTVATTSVLDVKDRITKVATEQASINEKIDNMQTVIHGLCPRGRARPGLSASMGALPPYAQHRSTTEVQGPPGL